MIDTVPVLCDRVAMAIIYEKAPGGFKRYESTTTDTRVQTAWLVLGGIVVWRHVDPCIQHTQEDKEDVPHPVNTRSAVTGVSVENGLATAWRCDQRPS
jgi:hypothetical protein